MLHSRAVTIATDLGSWVEDAGRLAVGSVAIIGGPGLDSGVSELAPLERHWGPSGQLTSPATCADACQALETADLVHVAAHGTFRADNPLFSSITFADGDLTLLEISELARVPAVVVLASCDAGATGPTAGMGDVVVGTAAELCRLGAQVVIAPTVSVNDAAAAEFSLTLHDAFSVGTSIDEAATNARMIALGSGEPRRIAAGHSFQLFGGSASRQGIQQMEG